MEGPLSSPTVIAMLHGRVAAIEADAVIVDVAGVGYRVRVPAPMAADLGPEGATVTVFTYLYVRENELVLFGAADRETIVLFEDLLSVSGVGPRLALAMLSTYNAPTLAHLVVTEDIARLSQVPGIGRKTAQRLVLDLRGRLEASGRVGGVPGGAIGGADGEALDALVALGYTRGEARTALAATAPGADASVEQRILAALRHLS
jgi:holliday junction DNA helicase RuvA